MEDLLQHVQHCFVGAAVIRAPKRADSSSNASERIGVRTACDPDSGS